MVVFRDNTRSIASRYGKSVAITGVCSWSLRITNPPSGSYFYQRVTYMHSEGARIDMTEEACP